jgi:hypothetical protein
MADFKGNKVGEPWSRWNSGQGSSPDRRFTVTGVGKEQRNNSKPATKKK